MLHLTTLLSAAAVLPLEELAASPRGSAPDLTWLMGIVAVLLMAISALAFGFRKVVMSAVKTRASRRDMQVVDVLPLGGKRQLAVVRCYDRTFALGLGEKNVDLIAELDTDAVQVDVETRGEERRAAFRSRLESAKARLLKAHDLLPRSSPGAPRTPDTLPKLPDLSEIPLPSGPIERPDGSREFVA